MFSIQHAEFARFSGSRDLRLGSRVPDAALWISVVMLWIAWFVLGRLVSAFCDISLKLKVNATEVHMFLIFEFQILDSGSFPPDPKNPGKILNFGIWG